MKNEKLHTHGWFFMSLEMISASQENRYFYGVNHKFLCEVCMNYNNNVLQFSFDNVTFV